MGLVCEPVPDGASQVGRREPNAPLRFNGQRRGCFDQLLDRLEDVLNAATLLALPPFELIESPGKFFVGGEELAEANESAHDGDVYFDGTLAGKDAGKHGYPLFGEGIRAETAAATGFVGVF